MGHKVWKLRILLRDLQDWAQRLKAEMDMRSTPCSPERALYMLQEHQAHKVSCSLKVLGLSNVTPHYPPFLSPPTSTFLCLPTTSVLSHPPLSFLLDLW